MASFWLEFEQGGQLQQSSFESESIAIGRDRSSDFILDHPTVSRQHALIVHQGGGSFQLVVLSRGGMTAVDGKPVQSTETDLYDGTGITLGKYTVRFRSHQAPKKPAGSGDMSDLGGISGLGSGVDGGTGGGGIDVPEEPEEEAEDGGASIVSWDEIAAASAAEEAASKESEAAPTDFERIRQGKEKNKEGSNPAIIIVGLAGAGLMLFIALSSGGGNGGGVAQTQERPFEEQEPVAISVSCIDPAACEQEAERSYERALDLFEQREVETGNLFEGYERLLQTQAYLQEAGINEIPDEMDEWQEKHDMAREELDRRFQESRMRFHQANQRGRYSDMVDILTEIEAYFPERTARENRWARDQENDMKSKGTYPRN